MHREREENPIIWGEHQKSVINAFKHLLTSLALSCQNDSELEKNAKKKVGKHFPKSVMNAEAAAAAVAARDEIQSTNNSKRVWNLHLNLVIVEFHGNLLDLRARARERAVDVRQVRHTWV